MKNEYTMNKQFVVFKLEQQYYGVDIQIVQIIERMKSIMRVPKASACIKGVMNLRGEIIPVVDMRTKFGLEARAYDEDTRIIIVKIDEDMIGIIVDQVKEVIELSSEQIETVPNMQDKTNANHVQGVGKLKEEDMIVTLLNLGTIIEEAFEV
ncbi:chemotaxis protein CheW [Niameybacter massiliensis]|uniref:Chemotaxis protein CheW n=1 Tax=Holtiella tumoricola TaxID=3018743 RepID=A0AA42DPC6_9FIRM|nr:MULTISPECIES: chemotaxis protein CheW [Lachnospirales]MDA3732610.1 chemotaxis protein CheW [Holtiella tumoricola]